MSDANAKKTLVEEGTHFKGALVSKCPIEVRGRIEGEVTAPSLTVSASGAVHGKVKVAALRSEGEIAGEFDADIVRLSGVVKDNTVLRAKSLEVKLSPEKGKMQVIFGECALEVGDMPSRETGVDKGDKSDKGAGEKRDAQGTKEEGKGGDVTLAPDRPRSVPPPPKELASIPPPSMNGAS